MKTCLAQKYNAFDVTLVTSFFFNLRVNFFVRNYFSSVLHLKRLYVDLKSNVSERRARKVLHKARLG